MKKSNINETWHLAHSKEEADITGLEIQLFRVFYAFMHWQEECEGAANGFDLGGSDLAVLHLIRMQGRPKTVYELAQLLNRQDLPNVHYCVKKLVKLNLIEKAPEPIKKSIGYQITELGRKDTEKYSQMRRDIFVKLFLEEAGNVAAETAIILRKLKNAYEEASRIVAFYQGDPNKL